MAPNTKSEPTVHVGIIDRRNQVRGYLDGQFHADGIGYVTGAFATQARGREVVLSNEAGQMIGQLPAIRLSGADDAVFRLFGVIIGNQFHWERPEDQTFRGNLLILARSDGTIAAINEIPIERYLTSVISSEMRAEAPVEFLNTCHTVEELAYGALERKKTVSEPCLSTRYAHKENNDEILGGTSGRTTTFLMVCADDHSSVSRDH